MNAKFFVPFETAKVLEGKEYPQRDSDMYYNPNGTLFTQAELDGGYKGKDDRPIMIPYYTAAPTYHEVADWLQDRGYPIETMWIKEGSNYSMVL